jgi:hypothetical protein
MKMTTLFFDGSEEIIKRVCRAAFPGYDGRKFQVAYGVKSMSVRSYWDGGSRSSFVAVNLSTLQTKAAPNSHPIFDHVEGVDRVEIPEGFAIVEHIIFCGKDLGLRIHVPIDPPVLPEGKDVPDEWLRILTITAHRKSSYAGISDYRVHAAMELWGYKKSEVDAIRLQLIEAGYLAKNKSITIAGKNLLAANPKYKNI